MWSASCFEGLESQAEADGQGAPLLPPQFDCSGIGRHNTDRNNVMSHSATCDCGKQTALCFAVFCLLKLPYSNTRSNNTDVMTKIAVGLHRALHRWAKPIPFEDFFSECGYR